MFFAGFSRFSTKGFQQKPFVCEIQRYLLVSSPIGSVYYSTDLMQLNTRSREQRVRECTASACALETFSSGGQSNYSQARVYVYEDEVSTKI